MAASTNQRSLVIPPSKYGTSSTHVPSFNSNAAMFLLGTNPDKTFPSSESSKAFAKELKHRFDKLPIHKTCFNTSYQPAEAVRKELKNAISPSGPSRVRKMFCDRSVVSGHQQDCLGMSPLHLLACSRRHDLKMYEMLIETYPEHLIAEDNWGDIPLLYALWSNAPQRVIQLLVERQRTLFPKHVMNWKEMIETFGRSPYVSGRGSASLVCIQNLLQVQENSFAGIRFDWKEAITQWAAEDTSRATERNTPKFHQDTFKYLISFSISDRVNSLSLDKWRQEIRNDIATLPWLVSYREKSADQIYSKLAHYEQLDGLREATSLLELALWKASVERSILDQCVEDRESCRIRSGADIVVPNVLSFLLPE